MQLGYQLSAPRKNWDSHSERWKREKEKQGLSRSKWDSWFKLSAKSRATTDPYKYARGQSVADQRRVKLEKEALAHLKRSRPHGRVSMMQLGVSTMTTEELKWTIKATPMQLSKRAQNRSLINDAGINPWWYQ